MAAVVSFMESPLVTWVQTFGPPGDQADFQDLCDGVFLNDVMLQIDQRDQIQEINRVTKDANARIQNWDLLLRSIRTYYQEMLQQVITMSRPDVLAIVREPSKESSLNELKKVLLLILGCAVQCDRKEDYVDVIKGLDISTQAAIVEHIKEVTDNSRNIVNIDIPPDLDDIFKAVYDNIKSLVQERDHYAESLLIQTQERDYYKLEAEGKKGPLTAPPGLQKYHLHKELTLHKNKTQKLQEELEEKVKVIEELKTELRDTQSLYAKIKGQNLSLSKDAKAARTYRDELDMYKEKALKVERYEKEIRKYKEKLNELEFFKSRVEELREDNSTMLEAKTKMEEQLTVVQKRCENVMDELVRVQLQLEETNNEKEEDRRKMQQLIDENASLEFERSNMKEGTGIRRILSYNSTEFLNSLNSSQTHIPGNFHPISEELNDSMTCKAARLELENDELKEELNETKELLDDAKQELQKLKDKTEKEYQKKVFELEQKTKELRNRNSRELSREYQAKLAELEKQSEELKKRMSLDCQDRLKVIERQNEELQKKLKFTEENWMKDKEQYAKLQKQKMELLAQQEQFKQTIDTIRQNSNGRIHQLEKEINILSSRTAAVKKHTEKISNLCDNEINKDNVHYFAMRPEFDSPTGSPPGSPLKGSSSPLRASSPITRVPSRQVQSTQVQTGQINRTDSSTQAIDTSGVVMRRTAPTRGVVSPQRRSASPAVGTVHPEQRPSSAPVRKTLSVMPERRSVSPANMWNSQEPIKPYSSMANVGRNAPVPSGDRPISFPEKSLGFQRGSTGQSSYREKFSGFQRGGIGRNTFHGTSGVSYDKYKGYGSDKDSGHATSPDSPLSDTDKSKADHFLTSVQVISSETIKQQMKTTSLPRMNDKWKVFVDKIVDLQDKNQQLIMENSEMRRDLNKVKHAGERIEALERKNLQLEVENRKLRKICETLQACMAGKNPYDKREYHYFTAM